MSRLRGACRRRRKRGAVGGVADETTRVRVCETKKRGDEEGKGEEDEAGGFIVTL
jgi:hypothetical protein